MWAVALVLHPSPMDRETDRPRDRLERGSHGLDLVLAAATILIAFFTAHKYMPKHYNENIVPRRLGNDAKTVAKYENVFNEN